MKKYIAEGFYTLVVIALSAAIIALSVEFAEGAPMNVKIDKVAGKVEMQSGAAAAWKSVSNGMSAPVGATLRTGPGASCVIVWAGGNVMKITPMSMMKIAAADKDASGKEKSSLELKNGKIIGHAKPLGSKGSTYTIGTPTAVAGVRGTDPFAEVTDNGNSTFGVADGSLEVTSGDETVVVDEGFFIDIDTSGNMSEPEVIPPEMMEEIKEDLKEVNDSAKQSESEAASGEGAKEEKADKEEKAAKEEGGKEEAEKEEGDKEEAGGEEETAEQDTADSVGDTVDDILDNNISNDVVDSAEDAAEVLYDTGDVEVIIDLSGQQ